MKRFACLLLVLALGISLCACGSNTQSPSASVAAAASEKAGQEGDHPSPAESPATEPPATEPPATEPPATEPPADPTGGGEALFTRGTVNGYTYENSLLGYGCTLEGWTFADDEAIASNNETTEALLEDDLQSLFTGDRPFTDMLAQSASNLQNVIIQFQKMSYLSFASMNMDAMLESVKPSISQALENAGYTVISIEKAPILFGGEELQGISVEEEVQSIPVFQKQLFLLRGEYLVTITVTSVLTDLTDAVLAQFYRLDGESPTQSGSSPVPATAAPASEETDPVWTGDTLFSLGTVNGDTYESSFLGYGVRLKDWTFADEERIAELNHIALESIKDSDVVDLIRNSNTFIEMYAESATGLQIMSIQFQNRSMYGYFADLETLVDLAQPMVLDGLNSSGYQNVTLEKTTVMLDGEEHFGIAITGEINELPVYQKQVCFDCGDYVVFITVASMLTDRVDEILAQFYHLD